MKILSQMYPWTRKSLLHLGSNPNTDSGSRPDYSWWRCAVPDCSCSVVNNRHYYSYEAQLVLQKLCSLHWQLFAQLTDHFILYDYLVLFVKLNVTVDEADLDVLPQEPIDEDDIPIGLRWEDIAHDSTGMCNVDVLEL